MTAHGQAPLLEQVSAEILDEVEFFMRDYGADVSLPAYISAQQAKYFPSLLANIRTSEPDWTDEQVVADGTRHLLSGEQLLWSAIARRIVSDEPGELAKSVSLYARLELWWGTRDERGNYLNFSHEMLRALSAGDTFVIQKFAAVVPNFADSGPWDARVLHNGVIAAIHRNEEQLAVAVDEFARWKTPKKYLACFYTALTGLLQRNPSLVLEGITSFLKASRRLHQDDRILRVISLEAHGIYELCRWYAPELVAFRPPQGLPWDQQLCEWVASSSAEHPFYNVSALSPGLQKWLEKLPIYDGRRHDWA